MAKLLASATWSLQRPNVILWFGCFHGDVDLLFQCQMCNEVCESNRILCAKRLTDRYCVLCCVRRIHCRLVSVPESATVQEILGPADLRLLTLLQSCQMIIFLTCWRRHLPARCGSDEVCVGNRSMCPNQVLQAVCADLRFRSSSAVACLVPGWVTVQEIPGTAGEQVRNDYDCVQV